MKDDYDLTHGTVSYVRTLYGVIAFFVYRGSFRNRDMACRPLVNEGVTGSGAA